MKTRIHIAAPLIALSLAAASVALAQQGDKLGKVEFPNSCSPAVQEKFLRGGSGDLRAEMEKARRYLANN